MQTAIVKIISPVLHNGAWLNSGEHPMPLDEAQAQERAGMVDIVSVDGAPFTWAACCCGGGNDHGAPTT